MKVVHIITSLGDGGAEHTLYKICKYDKINNHTVITLKYRGKYFSLLNKLGIKVYYLNLKYLSINKVFFLIKLLRFLKPDVVQTWLIHGDFIGGIAAKLAGIKNIVWNIRYSRINIKTSKILTFIISKILIVLSHFIPKKIIIVSRVAKKNYVNLGYQEKKMNLIPNGYDLSILKPNNIEKQIFRNKLKLNKNVPLLGKVARYDPRKDHSNLLNALSIIKKRKIFFVCILVGTQINKNKRLIDQIKKLGLEKNVKLLGPKQNISLIMNAIDVHIQSSSTEGFPNVLAEAMAHQTPCVATNVGETSFIIGKTGWVTVPKNPKKLAKMIDKSILEIGTKKWGARCKKARSRIIKNFSITKMIRLYNEVWKTI